MNQNSLLRDCIYSLSCSFILCLSSLSSILTVYCLQVRNDYQPSNMMFTKLQEVEDESDTGDPNAYRTSFSWDGLRNVDTSLQRFIHNSDSNTDLESVTKSQTKSPKPTPFRWDHFLSWGPSFEKLVGVFADIAELPQDQHDEIDLNSIRSSEEYVQQLMPS